MFEMNGVFRRDGRNRGVGPNRRSDCKDGIVERVVRRGPSRDVSLGEDMHGSRAVRAAREERRS